MRLDDENDALVCDYCGSVHYPDPNDEGVRILEPVEFDCPVCAKKLSLAVVGGQRVFYCQDCRGMLAAMETFLPLIGKLRADRGSFAIDALAYNPRDLERKLLCPKCRGQMDTHLYGGPGNVVIDSCEKCEWNWLDRGELARIVACPDHAYGAA